MYKQFKLGWPLAIAVVIGLVVYRGGLLSRDRHNLAISNEVIEAKWKPRLERELEIFYNNKAISSTSNPTQMAALVDRISQLKVTSVTIDERPSSSTSFTLSNNPDRVYANVTYEMPGGTPDGQTTRRLRLILQNTNEISRVEF